LQKVIIETVNLVGLDLNEIKRNEHLQNQVQFVSGLGPKKAQHLLERLKDMGGEILNRSKM
jgi:transcription elongation factor SPT6